MRKILIAKQHKEIPETISIPLAIADKYVQALKDNHFQQVLLQLQKNEINNTKLLIYIPRILKNGAKFIISSQQKQQRDKLGNVASSLGLTSFTSETQTSLIFIKPEPVVQNKEQKVNQLHIGFHAATQKINEDDLLKDDVIVKKSKPEDCATKPKACANCKCGRKQQLQKQSQQQTVKQIQQGTVKSNCGSCYLGDAFRCATCPYRGLPAFKPGDKIELSSNDIVTESSQSQVTKVEGGKVKLDLE